MGVKLMVEAMDYAPETLTPRERYVLLVLAENARDSTRACFPGIEDDPDFVRRSRLASRSQRYAVIQALVTKKVLERARRGQKGVRAEYRIVKMAGVQGPGNQDPDDAAEAGEAGVQGPGNAEAELAQGPENQDAENRDADVQGPGSEGSGSRFSSVRVPENGTPSPHTPQPPQGGVGGEDPLPRSTATARHSQPSLIPLHSVKLPEPVDLIYRWGLWNGYENTTPDEAREVHKAFRRRYGSKPLSYLEKMASTNGGGFYHFYQEVRSQRAAELKDALKRLVETEPECEHGTEAGRAKHPLTGQMLCALCRAGRAPKPDDGPTTPPDVASAMDAYHDAYLARHGSALKTDWLLRISHQAAALAARGLPADQLADIATRAGGAGTDLFTAATERTAA